MSATITPGTAGTSAFKGGVSSIGAKYHSGNPGSIMWGEGAECSEAMAYAAGHAVATNTPAHLCEHIQGMKIIIGDTVESIQGGFEMVNMNFATSGTQPAVSNNFNLNGPIG